MIRPPKIAFVLALLTGLAHSGAPLALAQAYNYPALQTPRLVDREYNFAAASASKAGTSLIFQWREAMRADWQFTLDGGIAAPRGGGNTRAIIGAAVAWQATKATDDFPFDVALTAGAGFSSGSGYSVLRVPFGAAVGHTFDLQDGFSLTPYVHPRLSVDRCSVCNKGGAASKLNVDVDIGLSFVVTPQVALRMAALLGGSDYVGGTSSVGFSVAWTPLGLKK
ncbi:MAG TPA: hypothetical protein VHE78_19985 [Gemmatimonadaceae bacterium]|nr:hypothetical protein [Gemmatimonadaceae bacterium]